MHHPHHGFWFPVQHWLSVHLGFTNGGGVWYLSWSGFLSDVGEYTVALTLAAGLAHTVRRHNCREHGCWRVGLHTYVDVDGQPHPACRRHHPTMADGGRFHFDELHRRRAHRHAVEDREFHPSNGS